MMRASETMPAFESVKAQIREAFAGVPYPGAEHLINSYEGEEPFRVENDFKSKRDWRALDPEFIDQSPDGLASALNFFSHEAFRFYLPAYLIADLDHRLKRVNPVFHLTHGLDDLSSRERINPQRYGDKTWAYYARERFSAFTREQAAAVVAYLTLKRDTNDWERGDIAEALRNYWSERAVTPDKNSRNSAR